MKKLSRALYTCLRVKRASVAAEYLSDIPARTLLPMIAGGLMGAGVGAGRSQSLGGGIVGGLFGAGAGASVSSLIAAMRDMDDYRARRKMISEALAKERASKDVDAMLD